MDYMISLLILLLSIVLYIYISNGSSIQHNVCILSHDVPFIRGSGGTSTALYSLAIVLAQTGLYNHVYYIATLIPNNNLCNNVTIELFNNDDISLLCLQWIDFYEQISDNNHLTTSKSNATDLYTRIESGSFDLLSYALVQWWSRQGQSLQCDVIHMHEWTGVYLPLVTHIVKQRYDNNWNTPVIVVQPHGGHMWANQYNYNHQSRYNILSSRLDNAERQLIELADYIISPAQYMCQWIKLRSWRMRRSCQVLYNSLAVFNNKLNNNNNTTVNNSMNKLIRVPVNSIMFVGRLEERKGIILLLDVLDILAQHHTIPEHVIIAGSITMINDRSSDVYINQRAKQANTTWGSKLQLYTNLTQIDVFGLLQRNNTLLVVPSLIENLPYAVAEAVLLNTPFITTNIGGTNELLHNNDVFRVKQNKRCKSQLSSKCVTTVANNTVLVNGINVWDWAQVIYRILIQQSHYTAQLSNNMMHADQQWIQWHQQLQYEPISNQYDTSTTINNVVIIELPSTATTYSALYRTICRNSNLIDLHSTYKYIKLHSTAQHNVVYNINNIPTYIQQQTLVVLLPYGVKLLNTTDIIDQMTDNYAKLKSYYNSPSNGATLYQSQYRLSGVVYSVAIDNHQLSQASSPSWILYGSHVNQYTYNVPLSMTMDELCHSFDTIDDIYPQYTLQSAEELLYRQNGILLTDSTCMFYVDDSTILLQDMPIDIYDWIPSNITAMQSLTRRSTALQQSIEFSLYNKLA